ncbi:hypothetical protein AAFC00_002909 [Neodothiora populina]|uniref:Nitrogen regulatory protein areA GATA-like domain-containing protein n=1 Tax=Neodothiora populina TaxID=2781224 RepID=A0ABR3P8L9_9PEZI
MAEVLTRSRDDKSYYTASSLKRSAPSRTSLLVGSPPKTSSLRPAASESSFAHVDGYSRQFPSSSSASLGTRQQSCTDFSQFSQPPSFSTARPPTLSFESQSHHDDYDDGSSEEEEIAFPAYDEVHFYHEDEPLPPSPRPEDDDVDTSTETETHSQSDGSQASPEPASTTDSTRSDSPLPTPTVADDTAIKHEPSRHVDYLSHDWREEDIWSSWRHIVSQRKVYGQRSRLENASWRTWAKSKYQLATVSPETLNWLKESDVTWLYGPLQPAATHPLTQSSNNTPSQLSTSSSFVGKAKKPILKKRSMSEVMLQRSISASSLVKQAAASVQAQQSIPIRRPDLSRASSAFTSPAALSVPASRDHLDFLDLDYFSPRPSSGEETPFDGPKRHIRFDDKVEQCIAVDCKDGEDEDSDDGDRENPRNDSDSDSSDDGIVMMKRPKRKRQTRRSASRTNSSNSKTIEKLPDTKLKYKDEPPTPEPVVHHTPFGRSWSSSKLSPSASQETLRPVSSVRNYVLPPDDEDNDFDAESFRASAFPNRRDSIHVRRAQTSDSTDTSSELDEQGLNTSNPGMFVPYEEDEDDLVAAGLFGKVSDTINTAKDIAHVIWNVGWRK